MPKKQHRKQIISTFKQYEGGEKTAAICRKLGVSQATVYMRKKAVHRSRRARAARVV